MDMSVSKKELNLLIGLIGVLAAVAVWFLVASPNQEKTAALEAENATLKPKAEEYEAVNARLDEYELGIINNQNEFNEIIDHYPSDVQAEDAIMLWANFDKAYPEMLRFSDLEIEEIDPVAVAGVEDIGNAQVVENEDGSRQFNDSDMEEITAMYKLYAVPVGMSYICTYDGMKKIFAYLESQHDRLSINQFDIAYDESTGYLTGSIWVEQYYLEGIEKEYSPSFIPSVPKGQSNLFHTGDIPLEELIKAANEGTGEKIVREVPGLDDNIEANNDNEEDEEE